MEYADTSSKTLGQWTAGSPLIKLALARPRDRLTKRQQERLRARPPRQMRRISVSVLYLLTQRAGSSITHTPPAPMACCTILSSYLLSPVHSLKSPGLGRPTRKWRTHSTPTSTSPEPATAPPRPQRNHRTSRRTARGYRNQLPTPNASSQRPRRLHPHSTMKSSLTRKSSPSFDGFVDEAMLMLMGMLVPENRHWYGASRHVQRMRRVKEAMLIFGGKQTQNHSRDSRLEQQWLTTRNASPSCRAPG